jgi:hypothetical protein
MITLRRSLASLVMVSLATMSGAQQGCSFTTNTTSVQCTSESECLSLGPEFVNTTCDAATKTCKKVESPVECNLSADCSVKAPGSVCRRNKCVKVLTDECTTIRGRPDFLSDDNTLIIGAITPFEAGTELGDAIERGADMAQREIAPDSTATGIPVKGGKTKPVVIVSCREFNADGIAGLRRGAEHLVNDLQVPVVLGPIDPTNAQIVATTVTIPNKVLTITTAVSSSLDSLNPPGQPPLLLRTNWSDREALLTLQPFLQKWLVPRLIADGAMVTGEDLRVGIIAEGDYKGLEGGRVITNNLTWNLKTPAEGGDGTPANCAWNQTKKTPSACYNVDFGSLIDTLGNPTPEGKIANAIAPLLRKDGQPPPHVILHSYAVFGIPRILFPLEETWEEQYDPDSFPDGRPEKRPYHIGLFPPFNTFTPLWTFMDVESRKSGRHTGYIAPQKRLFALDVHPDAYLDVNTITDFQARFIALFPEFRGSDTPSDSLIRQFYDSVYLAVYATAALGDKPLTGANLAEAIQTRLVKAGEKIPVGAGDLQRGFAALSQGLNIDLQGISGNLDFTPRGSMEYSVEMMCPDRTGNGVPTNTKPSGLYFDVATQRLVGEQEPQKNCPFLQ